MKRAYREIDEENFVISWLRNADRAGHEFSQNRPINEPARSSAPSL
jgi:hypothetical protein